MRAAPAVEQQLSNVDVFIQRGTENVFAAGTIFQQRMRRTVRLPEK